MHHIDIVSEMCHVWFSDWNATEYGKDPVAAGDSASLLPLVINNLTPEAVGVVGEYTLWQKW